MARRKGMTRRRGSRKPRTLKRRVKRHQGRKRTRVGRKRHSRRQNRGYARGTGGTTRKRDQINDSTEGPSDAPNKRARIQANPVQSPRHELEATVICSTPCNEACLKISQKNHKHLLVAQGVLSAGEGQANAVDNIYKTAAELEVKPKKNKLKEAAKIINGYNLVSKNYNMTYGWTGGIYGTMNLLNHTDTRTRWLQITDAPVYASCQFLNKINQLLKKNNKQKLLYQLCGFLINYYITGPGLGKDGDGAMMGLTWGDAEKFSGSFFKGEKYPNNVNGSNYKSQRMVLDEVLKKNREKSWDSTTIETILPSIIKENASMPSPFEFYDPTATLYAIYRTLIEANLGGENKDAAQLDDLLDSYFIHKEGGGAQAKKPQKMAQIIEDLILLACGGYTDIPSSLNFLKTLISNLETGLTINIYTDQGKDLDDTFNALMCMGIVCLDENSTYLKFQFITTGRTSSERDYRKKELVALKDLIIEKSLSSSKTNINDSVNISSDTNDNNTDEPSVYSITSLPSSWSASAAEDKTKKLLMFGNDISWAEKGILNIAQDDQPRVSAPQLSESLVLARPTDPGATAPSIPPTLTQITDADDL